MNGTAMRTSTRSPSQYQKEQDRDLRRQNTSSDVLGTRRAQNQKIGSADKDIGQTKRGVVQSNPLLTRETSFKAPINIEVDGKMNKENNREYKRGSKRSQNQKHRKGARHTSK